MPIVLSVLGVVLVEFQFIINAVIHIFAPIYFFFFSIIGNLSMIFKKEFTKF